MYDVVIIGAGVSGSAIARELSRYEGKFCVVEQGEDVCVGTSKANSGIVHAGFDAKPDSLMARLNVEGNQMMKELSEELEFSFWQNGSLVVCLNKDEMPALTGLYERGIANGVKDLEIISGRQAKEMEPNLADSVYAALYAPTAGIVCPFGLNIALAENAATNGVEFRFHTEVEKIVKREREYLLETNQGVIETRYIVNAAGVYADKIHNMVSEKKIRITPRRGEYLLLDNSIGAYVKHTIFQVPTKLGKGILVTPTAHGNMMLGPTARDIEEKEGTNTTSEGIATILEKVGTTVKEIPKGKVITSFAGLRAHEEGHEFIIGEVEDVAGFIDCAGIESPGLTSSPAIGRMVGDILRGKMNLTENIHFQGKRKGLLNPKALTKDEYNKLIKENPTYGIVVCRCERVTEGEIVDAIRRPLGATTLDGIKRRTRAGMGRCQSGFCAPKVMEILARELQVDRKAIRKSGVRSEVITGKWRNE